MVELAFERIFCTSANFDYMCSVYRSPVPGGWLVAAKGESEGSGFGQSSEGVSVGLTFVPDPNHEWRSVPPVIGTGPHGAG